MGWGLKGMPLADDAEDLNADEVRKLKEIAVKMCIRDRTQAGKGFLAWVNIVY